MLFYAGGTQEEDDKDPASTEKRFSVFEMSFISYDQGKRFKKQYHRAEEIKRIHNEVLNSVRLTETNYGNKRDQLKEYWRRFELEHEDIKSVKTADDDNEVYFFNDLFEDMREFFIETLETIDQKLLKFKSESGNNVREAYTPEIKLPRIDLQKFNGNFSAWSSFKESFTKLIIESRLSGADKLQHLKASLTGKAVSVIKHLDILDANFDVAWKLIDMQSGTRW